MTNIQGIRLCAVSCTVSLLLCAVQAQAQQKYYKKTLTGKWTVNSGFKLKAGDDECIVNFTAGQPGDCAEKIVTKCNGVNNFKVTRIGTKVTVCHTTKRPKIVDLSNVSNGKDGTKAAITGSSALFVWKRLIEVRGTAVGGGTLRLTIEDLEAEITTIAGQSAEEVANALVSALDEITPDDDTSYAFTTAFVGADGIPTDSVDIGIESLGTRDLANLEFFNSDSGITLFEEGPFFVPTVSKWGLMVMTLLVLTAGTVVVGWRRRAAA